MIAYNHQGLDNEEIQEEMDSAFSAGLITHEERLAVFSAYPRIFYTPNIYLRIGLFLLTIVIVSFSAGLLSLLFISGGESFIGVFLALIGLGCYGTMEYIIRTKKHFRSGVDDALMWMGGGFLLCGINFSGHFDQGPLFQCQMVFLISGVSAIRYADRLMAVLSYAALLGLVFYTALHFGKIGKTILPFLLMGVSVAVYLMVVLLRSKKQNRHYPIPLDWIKTATLLSFYLASNYLVIRELSAMLADYSPEQTAPQTVPLGWLFWLLTLSLPFMYIFNGIRKKDRIFIISGLILIGAAVFTVRQYHALLPVELAMVFGGLIIIGISWWLIKWLTIPRSGFTSLDTGNKKPAEAIHIESLIIAETFTPTAPPASGTQFGGGSGGGGGAGGEF